MNALMAVAAACTMLLARLASGSDVDYGITESGELTVNNKGSSAVETVMLSETAAIVCYATWGNDNDGFCNALDLSNSATSKGAQMQINGTKPAHFKLARFSDTKAVVCYVRLGDKDGMAMCHTVEVQGDWSLTFGEQMIIDPQTIFLHQIDVASLTETSGVVCYGDTSSIPNLKVKCLPFTLDGSTLEKGTPVRVDEQVHHVQSVSVTPFTATTALVCYAVQDVWLYAYANGAWCSPIFYDGTALTTGGYASVNAGSTHSLSTARLTEDSGVLCYVDAGNGPYIPRMEGDGKCRPLSIDVNNSVELGEVLVVDSGRTSNVTIAGMSPTAAMVCYASGTSQVGSCNGLVLSHGTELAMGEDKYIGDTTTFTSATSCRWEKCGFFMSVSAYASPLNMNGLVCYAGVGGNKAARCSVLSVPPPTTTTTATSMTETSSTTPHTTTETSSTTMTTTETTASTSETTFTTATTSTTPHTTTETSTTEAEEVTVSSNAAQVMGGAAAAALASMAALL